FDRDDVDVLLSVRRRGAKLVEAGINLRKPGAEGDRAGQEIARELFELQPDLDQLAIMLRVGIQVLLQLVGLCSVLLDGAALLLDQRIARIAETLRRDTRRKSDCQQGRQDENAPKAYERHYLCDSAVVA